MDSKGDRRTLVRSLLVPNRPIVVIGRVLGTAVLVVLLLLLQVDGTPFMSTFVEAVAINGCLGLAVVVLLGYAGEFSFAYALIFGVAGYAAYEFEIHGVPVWPAMALGMLSSIVAGALVALPALRVRLLQLALATFGAAIAGLEIFSHYSTDAGISPLPPVSVRGFPLGIIDVRATALVVVCVLLVTFIFTEAVVSGQMGRRWLLMKAHEPTARSLGIRVHRERIRAFVLSSAILGAIGAIYPSVSGILSPSPYELQTVINVLIIAIIGGILAPGGALLGAILFQVLLQEMTNAPPGLSYMTFGIILMLALAVLPRGVVGLMHSGQRIGRLRFSERKTNVQELSLGMAAKQQTADDSGQPVAAERLPLVSAVARPEASASLTVKQDSDARDTIHGQGLEASGLTKHFGAFVAVDDVAIEIPAMKVTGIIGANGAGKSTLLDLITGFQKAEAGDVSLVESGSSKRTEVTRRGSVGRSDLGIIRTFQRSLLVEDLTIEDNVRVAKEMSLKRSLRNSALDHLSISSILELAGVAGYRKEYPGTLPFGVIKLVDVARLLAAAPVVALLDEPAAGLGGGETPYLEAVINYLINHGTAVMIIEHNLDFIVKVADQLYAMDFGKVIVSGSPASVLASPEVRNAYSVQANIGMSAHEHP